MAGSTAQRQVQAGAPWEALTPGGAGWGRAGPGAEVQGRPGPSRGQADRQGRVPAPHGRTNLCCGSSSQKRDTVRQSKPSSRCPSTSGSSPRLSQSPRVPPAVRGGGSVLEKGADREARALRLHPGSGGAGLSANLRPVPSCHLLPAGPGSGWSPGRGTGLGPAEGSVTPFASVPQACGAECDRDAGGSEQSRGRSDPQRAVLTGGSGSWGPVRPQLHPGRPGKPLRDVTGAPRLLLRWTPQERPLLLKRAVVSEPQ